MKKSMILLGMLSIGYAHAQSTDPYEGKVGVNTNEPKATLDITAYKTDGTTKEGLLIPRLSKKGIAEITNPETSTLVYVTDVTYTTGTNINADSRVELVNRIGFYYFSEQEQKWVKIQDRSGNVANRNKTLVYTDRNPNAESWGGGTPRFGTVPSNDPSFVNNPSLAKNTDYLYVSPSGVITFWSPTDNRYIEYVEESDVLFYKSNTVKDAAGKGTSMFRTGNIGIGISSPISSLHSSGSISGGPQFYRDISVNPNTGNNSPEDTIFATLDEAVAYANSIVNTGIIRITLLAGQTYDLTTNINRDIKFNGRATININNTLLVKAGVNVHFEGQTINQKTMQAFRTYGHSQIVIGGHNATTWNFTGNDQTIVYNYYGDWGNGGEVYLSINRATLNTGSFTGTGFATSNTLSTGRVVLSQWQATLPTNISYAGIARVLLANNDDWNSRNNQVGDIFTISGLDKTQNNALIEHMRVDTKGNVGIGTTTPTHKLHIVADANPLKLEGLQEGTGSTLVVDANGVIKKGTGTASTVATNGLQNTTGMPCNEDNRGKMNFIPSTDNTKSDVFGICMRNKDGNYYWAYMVGGNNPTNGTGTFGSGL